MTGTMDKNGKAGTVATADGWFGFLAHWQSDLPASIVVLLVALPLCLGIALASGAPAFSGIISGVIGGVVIGALSKSPLSVSGPAAGLTVIVLGAIQSLPTFEAFLLSVFLAGALQVCLGAARAGVIGDFVPSSVIKGMLAAIGIILILKQLPHAVGYDADYVGDETFLESDGNNTFTALLSMFGYVSRGALAISLPCILFLFWWDKRQPRLKNFLRYLPGPLVAVAFGVAANLVFRHFLPALALEPAQLVTMPAADSTKAFLGQFRMPDFSFLDHREIWITAATLAIVASLETLLSVEAIDKLDPYKRITPTSRELVAQGIGNMTAGMLGGLPVTSVIVRSSANVNAGARTKLSAILHGLLLLLCVIGLGSLLNLIPLAALAAILITTGYKLTKPEIFFEKYAKGLGHLIPFVVTIAAILLTDLLMGIAIGVVVGICFVLIQNFRSAIFFMKDEDKYLVKFKKDLFFIHKYELKQRLNRIPAGANLLIDFSRVNFIDLDNVEIINDFIAGAKYRGIRITLKTNQDSKTTHRIRVPDYDETV